MVSDFLQPDGVSHITDTCNGGPCYSGTFAGPWGATPAQPTSPEASAVSRKCPKEVPAILASSAAERPASTETRRGGSVPSSQVTVPGQ